jgi:hypothetical protein
VTACWHPDALAEADAAAESHRDKRREPASRFLNSLDEALNRIELRRQTGYWKDGTWGLLVDVCETGTTGNRANWRNN